MPASEEELPQFLRKLLDACPSAGGGVNDWIFRVGRHLHAHMAEETMFALLKEKSQGCGRVVRDTEIRRQIECSRRSAWVPDNPRSFKHADELQNDIQIVPADPAWPEPNLDLIRRIVSGRFLFSELRRMSPIKLDTEVPSHTETIIDAIWPGNPLLCCAKNTCTFATRRREVWRGHLSGCSLIVPNPMLKIKGLTREGKESEHTKEATAARVYLVVEFDFAEFAPDGVTNTNMAAALREWRDKGITVTDASAALHLHLSVARDLVLVTHSGGKSLHGWYACFDFTEEQNRKFFEYACHIGADPRTWLRSQFVRMPDGTRENGKRQTIFYFDPEKAVRT
jgi:hypothetical protein